MFRSGYRHNCQSVWLIAAVCFACLASPGHADQPEDAKTFTLAVGQGFRFADGAVVEKGKPRDLEFRVLAPGAGGLRPQFNGMTREMEWRPEATIDRNMPVLAATRVRDFVDAPMLDTITTGDLAAGNDSIYLSSRARHWIVQDEIGNAYLLRGKSAGTESPDAATWRFEFTYEKVLLPLGLPGGKKNPALPDRLLYRTNALRPQVVWCDLASGEQRVVSQGRSPSASANHAVASVTGESDWQVQTADGAVAATIKAQPELYDAVLSPDCKFLAGTSKVQRMTRFMDMDIPGPDGFVVRVIALDGKEVARFENATDAAWTRDGQLIAAPVEGNGLLRCDIATAKAAPLANIPTNAGQPAVSPDGKTVAYNSNSRVYLIDLAGGDPRPIWNDAKTQRSPVFSPDGRYVAFISENTIRVLDRTTGAIITPVSRAGWPLETDNGGRVMWAK